MFRNQYHLFASVFDHWDLHTSQTVNSSSAIFFTCPPKNISTELFIICNKQGLFLSGRSPIIDVDRIAEERVDDSLVHFGSFENETLLICIIYIQEKLHHSVPNADTGLPWCMWCWNSSLVYSFNIKLQVSGSSWWGGVVWFSCTVTSEEYWNSLTFDSA